MKWKSALLGFIKWTLAITYLIIALSFAKNRSQQVLCSKIDVVIADSLDNAFVTQADVLKTIEKNYSNLLGIPLPLINTLEIEQQIGKMQAIKSVQAFKTIDGTLTINIQQRKPMVRIINRYGQSYYIDNEGQILPLSTSYTSHVLIVNGNIVEPFEIEPNIKVSGWENMEVNENTPLIYRLYEFARFVTNSEFWNAQISQVYVESPTHIELIPRVGPHTVLLGSLDHYQVKLAKLKLFYERAMPEEGWNKYQQINLKYRNQIVCTKR